MSYSNAPTASINVNSITAKSINGVGKGVWATGQIGWFGTDVPAGANLNYSVLNGIVTLEVIIPATAVFAANAQVTFATALPAAITPVTAKVNATPAIYPFNTTAAARVNPLSYNIGNDGIVRLNTILAPAYANADNMGINALIQYSLL